MQLLGSIRNTSAHFSTLPVRLFFCVTWNQNRICIVFKDNFFLIKKVKVKKWNKF